MAADVRWERGREREIIGIERERERESERASASERNKLEEDNMKTDRSKGTDTRRKLLNLFASANPSFFVRQISQQRATESGLARLNRYQ